MSSAAWQLEKHVACLQFDQLGATVDLTRPAQGMVEVQPCGGSLSAAHLLGVTVPSLPAGDATSLIECYVRGKDLVGSYEDSAGGAVRVDVSWRAVSPSPAEKFVAAVELVVSVRTDLLDGQPELAVRSKLVSTETLRLVDADAARYRSADTSPETPTVMQPAEGPGCLLFRVPGMELSYAEMVHPADFQHDELSGVPGNEATMRISHRLFSERLEKGVILLARVRGVFVPRDEDTHIAAACYTAFAAAEPPLAS